MVARLTSIVVRYQKVAVSSTVTLIFFCPVIAPHAFSSETRLSLRHLSSSMFGQQQQQQPVGGPFGSTTQGSTSTGTGLFGSTTTQQPPGFGATQNPSTSTGTGLFGSTQQQPSTGIFGSTTTGTQGTGTGGGLFGSTNPQQQQQQQQQPQQGSLFGNTGATPGQQSTGGGLFGSTTTGTTQPSTGGLFGTGTSTQGTGSNIFGTPTTTSSTTGGGLFGAGTGTTTGGGLFGSTTQSTPSAGGGLFGSQPVANTQPTGQLFPSTTAQQPLTTSIFGTSTMTQPQQTQSGLFGQSTGGFGGNGGGLLSSTLSANTLRTSLASSQLNSDPGAQCAALMQRIEGIKNAWDAGSPQCKFQVSTSPTLRSRDRLPNSGHSHLALLLQSRRPQPSSHVWAPRERDRRGTLAKGRTREP